MISLRSPLTRWAGRSAVLAALACAALAPAAHAASTTLSTEQAVGPVAAWNGTVVWSSFDRAANDYKLVVSKDGGKPTALPVAPSPTPFDVDLGTNRNGSTYAVYTRCEHPGSVKGSIVTRGTGCDIYRLRIATGKEDHLTKLSAPAWDERDPTIFRGEIAFIRAQKSGGRTYDYLRIGNTTSGSKGTTYLGVKVRVTRFDSLASPELTWNRIAYVRVSEGIGFSEQDIHVRTLSGSSDKTVYKAKSGGANAADVTRPSLTEDLKAFVWARTNNGSGAGNRLVRYDISSGKLTYALGSSRWESTGWANAALGAAVFVDGSGTGTCFENINDTPDKTQCSVILTGPLAFNAKP